MTWKIGCTKCATNCPIGAVIDKRQLRKIRVWDGEIAIVNCKVCQYGCEFEVLNKKVRYKSIICM